MNSKLKAASPKSSSTSSSTTTTAIHPMRFRPNMVISGLDAWKEFDLVGKTIQVIPSSTNHNSTTTTTTTTTKNGTKATTETIPVKGMKIKIISTTVRCSGIGIDPTESPNQREKLDVPNLLNQHYPEYGPYFGVYAIIEEPGGSICIGDSMVIL